MKKDLGSYERVGLHLEFYEKNIIGQKEKTICIKATEHGRDCVYVSDEFDFLSIENLKLRCPTLRDLLMEMFSSHNWKVFNNNNNERKRVLYAKSIKGNDGIYSDLDAVVYNDEVK